MSAPWRPDGFSPLARATAELLARLGGLDSELLALTAALAVAVVEHGDTCLHLRASGGKSLGELLGDDCPEGRENEALPRAAEWEGWLRERGSPVLGGPGEYAPLVLDAEGRLYLHRYWTHEQCVFEGIRERLRMPPEAVDAALLREGIDRLFPPAGESPDWQRVAAAVSVLRRFAVVSGGPGTGKTHTLVRSLALLVEQGLHAGKPALIALAAPTGKAAARLAEAVRSERESLRTTPEVRSLIPAEASTLHRLMGSVRSGPGFAPGGQGGTLPHDVVVVDECSMADLSLMARLFSSLRPEARLILAGDKDQLASVEAGVVMGDVCDTGRVHGYAPPAAEEIHAACGERIPAVLRQAEEPALASCMAVLRRNYRMREEGGIARVARATNDGDATGVVEALRAGSAGEVHLISYAQAGELHARVSEPAVAWYREYTAAESAEAVLRAFARRAILCAIRRGPAGVEGINAAVASAIRRALPPRFGASLGQGLFPGLPIIVTVNDYSLRLFNGDIGIVAPSGLSTDEGTGEGSSAAACLFPRPEGGVRRVAAARLPPHEPAFALTVHKSQGSEFDEVLLVLPPEPLPVLCRELLYTAVTRARRRVTILGTEDVVRWMVEHPTVRRSGLRDLLWSP